MQQEEHEQRVDPPQTNATCEATSFSSLEKQLEEEQRKAEEYLDLLRRTQADFIKTSACGYPCPCRHGEEAGIPFGTKLGDPSQ